MRRSATALAGTWTALMVILAAPSAVAAFPQQPGARESVGDVRSTPKAKSKTGPHQQQELGGLEPDPVPVTERRLKNLEKEFWVDQKQIWTTPARIRFSDAEWLLPSAGIAAGLFVTDRDVSRHLSYDPKTISHYKSLSNAGITTLVGGAGGLWLLGHVRHDAHWSETGFLAGEAALNSLVAVEGLKYSLRRERPLQGDGNGSFFRVGTSFPSEHAAAAWAVAGVIAHEYPGPLTKVMAYGLASLVDYSRVRARQHFPSDVFVGSIMGNLIAQNIYSRHRDPGVGGGEWRSISELFRGEGNSSPANQGSPYVALDSWIYPALDRLAAMGLLDSGFAGMRPWTRRECERLLNEAQENLDGRGAENLVAADLLEALEREFRTGTESATSAQNAAVRLESVYSRVGHISGMPLNDGYHFVQTQINDFGRPYGEGWSSVTGFSTYATWGPWVGYVRGELQTAPGVPALPLGARQAIQSMDSLPQSPPAVGQSAVSQFRLLDAYVGLTFSNWELSFGRQTLWWGPGDGGPMMFSDNIQPMSMIRLNRVTPFKLPSVLGRIGPMRVEVFLGQMSGYDFVFNSSGLTGQFGQPLDPQPILHGQKVSFKPTPNLEFGFSRTTVYGGPGFPLTWHTLLRSLLSTGNTLGGKPDKPGDRRSSVDFSYRLPGLRNWLTFYGDGFTEDQYSPIAYADRSVWRAGLYLSHVPRLPKLDLRIEGVYSDNPLGGHVGPGYFYFNFTWRNGYTSNGYLIGNWIGRAGQGAQAWTNYWFTPKDRVQFSYRHQKVSQQFAPGGGTLTDVGVRGDYWLRSNLSVAASVQYEQWLFPVIQPGPQKNVAASIEIQFRPRRISRPSFHQMAQSATDAGDRN
jgi:capsule assembly protein Wzi/PAP2 superfamily protein